MFKCKFLTISLDHCRIEAFVGCHNGRQRGIGNNVKDYHFVKKPAPIDPSLIILEFSVEAVFRDKETKLGLFLNTFRGARKTRFHQIFFSKKETVSFFFTLHFLCSSFSVNQMIQQFVVPMMVNDVTQISSFISAQRFCCFFQIQPQIKLNQGSSYNTL